MFVFDRVFRSLRSHIRRVSWWAMLLAFLTHMLTTWLLFALAGEQKLVGPEAFPYYYMTTATTIGYGDLSPSTTMGRYVAAFVLMPGAVALFATVLAKTSASLLAFWRRHHMGKMSYEDMQGHTVLIGWRGIESSRLLQLLKSDTTTDDEGVVLVAVGIAENPDPEHIRFIAADCYTQQEIYARAGVVQAARVIVNPATDDQTLAAVFAVMAHRPTAHVVAHFDAATTARLVCAHYPQVECTRPLVAEVIARAAQDPGSSSVTAELLSIDSGPTQFSISPDPSLPALRLGVLARLFQAQGALLIGYRPPAGGIRLNPAATEIAPSAATYYYLAERRLDDRILQWEAASEIEHRRLEEFA